jgi:hypothetical protein
MPAGTGWYFLGPLIAVALVAFLCLVFWQLGGQWTVAWDDTEPRSDGLAILGFAEDYGLLCPAAFTDDPLVATEIRMLLATAGIRSTHAVGEDGRLAVLVFAEELDEARRLVGGQATI